MLASSPGSFRLAVPVGVTRSKAMRSSKIWDADILCASLDYSERRLIMASSQGEIQVFGFLQVLAAACHGSAPVALGAVGVGEREGVGGLKPASPGSCLRLRVVRSTRWCTIPRCHLSFRICG